MTWNEAKFSGPDFAMLTEHLEGVRPIFDEFCTRHGFRYVNRQTLGRYPRIRIERLGATKIWFDLWMELDESGKRFERFSPDLPYELSGGAYIDEQNGSAHAIRFQKAFQCFSGKPFNQVAVSLKEEMEKALPTLEAWDERYLKENGQKVTLSA